MKGPYIADLCLLFVSSTTTADAKSDALGIPWI